MTIDDRLSLFFNLWRLVVSEMLAVTLVQLYLA